MSSPAAGREVRYTHSPSFPEILARAGCSLLVSTYQAGQLVAIGTHGGGVDLSFRRFDAAMGVAVTADRVAVGSRDAVWTLPSQPEVASGLGAPGRYERCYLPRSSVLTGPVQGHELAWGRSRAGEPELWIVNTSFSCLATIDPRYSFRPRWRPPFVSGLAAQDRCHLNGLAMVEGRPGFVTVLARSDEPAGWRELPRNDGAVLDVATGDVVAAGFTMPHSPRWHGGHLLVLDSGTGRLVRLAVATGEGSTVARFPGFARGLALHAGLAFVGLSRIRDSSVFGGLPLSDYQDQLRCGVGVVDLATGETLATFEFLSGVEELFDVQVVPGARNVALSGPDGEEDIWVVPGSPGPVAGRAPVTDVT